MSFLSVLPSAVSAASGLHFHGQAVLSTTLHLQQTTFTFISTLLLFHFISCTHLHFEGQTVISTNLDFHCHFHFYFQFHLDFYFHSQFHFHFDFYFQIHFCFQLNFDFY